MAVARTLVAHEDAVLEAEASNPMQQKARELGVDPLWAPDRKAQTAAAFASAPRFLLLDFRCAVIGCTVTPAPLCICLKIITAVPHLYTSLCLEMPVDCYPTFPMLGVDPSRYLTQGADCCCLCLGAVLPPPAELQIGLHTALSSVAPQ